MRQVMKLTACGRHFRITLDGNVYRLHEIVKVENAYGYLTDSRRLIGKFETCGECLAKLATIPDLWRRV